MVVVKRPMKPWSGWWFHFFFLFSSLFGEDSHFDEYFSDGLKPPTSGDFFKKTAKLQGSRQMRKKNQGMVASPLLDVEKTCQIFKHQRWSLGLFPNIAQIHRARRELGFCLFFGSVNESATVRNLNEGEPRFNNYMASLYFHNEALVFFFLFR